MHGPPSGRDGNLGSGSILGLKAMLRDLVASHWQSTLLTAEECMGNESIGLENGSGWHIVSSISYKYLWSKILKL